MEGGKIEQRNYKIKMASKMMCVKDQYFSTSYIHRWNSLS